MNYWYVVEERCQIDPSSGALGNPISAEIVDCLPRKGNGHQEYHDTERTDGEIYLCRKWFRTKSDAEAEIKFWLAH